MAKNKNKTVPVVVPAATAASFPIQLLGWLSLGWALYILKTYWDTMGAYLRWPSAPPLSSHPAQFSVFLADGWALVLLITTLGGVTAVGSLLLRSLKLTWHSFLEELVLSCGLGLGVLGYAMLVLGALQGYRTPVFWVLWAIGLGLAVYRFREPNFLNRAALNFNRMHEGLGSWWLPALLLAGILAWALVMGFVPDIFYDSQVYHLGAPRWYLFEGGIHYLPFIHTQFPFLRQMINLFGLGLGGESLAKLLHGFSGPLIVATFAVLSRRYSPPRTGLIAGLAFFTMPMVNFNLWTAGIDVGLAAFALLAFLAWINGIADSSQRGRWFVLAGIFLGFCLGSKYPSAMLVGSICVVTWIGLGLGEKSWVGGLRWSITIGGVAVAVMAPWLIKSWILTGNPVYPYLHSVFGGRGLNPGQVATFFAEAQNGNVTWQSLLLAPWAGTFQGISSYTAPGVFLLGLLGFMVAVAVSPSLRQRPFLLGMGVFLLYWFGMNAVTSMMRFAFPGIVIGCYLLAHAAALFYARLGKAFRASLWVTVVLSAWVGVLSMLGILYTSYSPWDVLTGRETATEFVSYTHSGMNPYPATRMFEVARTLVPAGHRLLIVGDEKVSPAMTPFLASGAYNESLIVEWAKAAKDEAALAETFKRERVSHLLINPAETMRLYGYRNMDWDARSLSVYNDFFKKHLKLVRVEKIPEHYDKPIPPLFLYEFSEAPLNQASAQNILLELHYHFHPEASRI